MSNYGIVIQARTSSTRLPGKVLMDIEGFPMLYRQVDRLREFIPSVPVIVATSTHNTDDAIEDMCLEKKISYFKGSLDNVISRFLDCAKYFELDNIIRVGGDDPLIDPECCKALISLNEEEAHDFIYASSIKGWPYGAAAELISKDALEKINVKAKDTFYKEHTIPYFFDNPEDFRIKELKAPDNINRPNYFFTVDFPEDLELVRKIFKKLSPEGDYFKFSQVIELIDANPELLNINKHLHTGFDH